jgi:hypothetical protein
MKIEPLELEENDVNKSKKLDPSLEAQEDTKGVLKIFRNI